MKPWQGERREHAQATSTRASRLASLLDRIVGGPESSRWFRAQSLSQGPDTPAPQPAATAMGSGSASRIKMPSSVRPPTGTHGDRRQSHRRQRRSDPPPILVDLP